jgi:hypothetical protein
VLPGIEAKIEDAADGPERKFSEDEAVTVPTETLIAPAAPIRHAEKTTAQKKVFTALFFGHCVPP